MLFEAQQLTVVMLHWKESLGSAALRIITRDRRMDSFSLPLVRVVDVFGRETAREVVPAIWNVDGVLIFGLGIHMSGPPTSIYCLHVFFALDSEVPQRQGSLMRKRSTDYEFRVVR